MAHTDEQSCRVRRTAACASCVRGLDTRQWDCRDLVWFLSPFLLACKIATRSTALSCCFSMSFHRDVSRSINSVLQNPHLPQTTALWRAACPRGAHKLNASDQPVITAWHQVSPLGGTASGRAASSLPRRYRYETDPHLQGRTCERKPLAPDIMITYRTS